MAVIKDFEEFDENPFELVQKDAEYSFKMDKSPLNALMLIFNLRIREARLLNYIMRNNAGLTMMHLDIKEVSEQIEMAERSVYLGITVLLESKLIARSEAIGVYFLHPGISYQFYHDKTIQIKL